MLTKNKSSFFLLQSLLRSQTILLFFLCLFVCQSVSAKSTIVSRNPEVIKHYTQGIQYLLDKQFDLAEDSMLKALKLDPENGKIHWETGWVYWEKKKWDKVIFHWNYTRKFTPNQKELDKFYSLAKQYQSWEENADHERVVFEAPFKNDEEAGEITFQAVGDIMMGSDYKSKKRLPPNQGSTLFDSVKHFINGDIVFGNLEGPLTSQRYSSKCKKSKNCYAFRTPPHYAVNLKNAGFNVVNLANNHMADFGLKGAEDTMSALSRHRIVYFGNAKQTDVVIKVNNVKIGFLGVATSYCCVHINQLTASKKAVRRLKKQADIVVVSFHGGAEGLKAAHTPNKPEYFYGESRGHVRKFSHTMIDAGADLVLGHGPHTLRGMEQYKNKLIAYSLGNFLGYRGFSTSGHLRYTIILNLRITKSGDIKNVKVIPLVLSPAVVPENDPKIRAITLLNMLSESDFGKNAVLFDDNGNQKPN